MAARDVQVNVRVSDEALAAIDRLRGEMTRSAWVKAALVAALDDPEWVAEVCSTDPKSLVNA